MASNLSYWLQQKTLHMREIDQEIIYQEWMYFALIDMRRSWVRCNQTCPNNAPRDTTATQQILKN